MPVSPWIARALAACGFTLAIAAPLFAGLVVSPRTKAAEAPTPAAVTEAAYVGREVCAGCHASQDMDWASSHHARAMRHATPATVQGDFNDARFTAGGVTTTFSRDGDKFMVRTDGPDGALHDYDVKFTFGVAPLEQYLLELPGGRLQALSIAWDSRPKEAGGQRWFTLHPEETIKAGDPLHWTGLRQNWNFMCADCHATNLRRNFDAASGAYHTTYSEVGVSCESCHGPGSRHAAWARKEPGWESRSDKGLVVSLDERKDVSWSPDPKSGNPVRSAPRKTTVEIETCARCHSRRGPIANDAPGTPIGDAYRVATLDETLYFPDGQLRDEAYEYGSFLQSRMFHEGVTCGDCHQPHSQKLRAPGNGVCLQCHVAAKYETAAHNHHAPNSAGAQCVSCHMPTRTYMVVDPRRDHSIRIPRPDLSVSLGVPNACASCHADKPPQWAADTIKSWYGDLDLGFQRYAATLQGGSDGAPGARDLLLALAGDASNPGIARASAVERLDRITNASQRQALQKLLSDPDPLVRRAAAGVYGAAPRQLRPDLLPLLDDPIRDVRLEAAHGLADVPAASLSEDDRGRRDRGVAEYAASQRSNADRPEAHHNLGLLSQQLGRASDAETEFKKALEIDPDFVPASVTLADLYRATGRDGDAEKILRAALTRQPDAGAVHHALGLWLVRAGRRDEALVELKRAAELAPASAHYSYVYAVAVAGTGDVRGALEILRLTLARHAFDRESLFAAAGYAHDLGQIDAAALYANRLGELEPNDPNVRRFVDGIRN